jgi:uncharacterized protein (TIRG00374 family)
MHRLPQNRWIQQAGSLFVGGACLWWVLKDLRWPELAFQLRMVRWIWVCPAVFCEVGSYLLDATRWRLLFPRQSLTTVHALRATYIGVLVNQVLPMRLGELARAFVAGQWAGVPVLDVVPSLLVARLLDAVCVTAAIAAVALFTPLPPSLLDGVRLFGITVALLAVLFVLLMRRTPEAITRWAGMRSNLLTRRVRSFSGRIATGLWVAGGTSHFWPAVVISAAFLACQALAFLLVMRSCELSLPWLAGITVFLIAHLGTALPAAPANIGSFQLLVVLGLRMFEVDKATAAGFSLLVFVILTLPLFLAGSLALATSRLKMLELREGISQSTRMPAPSA